MSEKRYQSFTEFFPYYLGEHDNPLCRILHFGGTTMVLATVIGALYTQNYWPLLAVPLLGYGPAWIGHFVVEKNRPATFTYPLWSLMGDFKMWGMMLSGKLWTGGTKVSERRPAS